MSLELPADIEPFLEDRVFERLRGPAVYALLLERPEKLTEQWDATFDTRPGYFEELQETRHVVYVGGANDLLRRLNDHNDGEKRKSALLRVCEIDSLIGVWWFNDTQRAFERESGIALKLDQAYPATYFHQR